MAEVYGSFTMKAQRVQAGRVQPLRTGFLHPEQPKPCWLVLARAFQHQNPEECTTQDSFIRISSHVDRERAFKHAWKQNMRWLEITCFDSYLRKAKGANVSRVWARGQYAFLGWSADAPPHPLFLSADVSAPPGGDAMKWRMRRTTVLLKLGRNSEVSAANCWKYSQRYFHFPVAFVYEVCFYWRPIKTKHITTLYEITSYEVEFKSELNILSSMSVSASQVFHIV